MNLFCLFLASLTSSALANELENILARPETFAKSYLKQLNAKLFLKRDSLFNSALQPQVVSNFENMYGVDVIIQNPFLLSIGDTICNDTAIEYFFQDLPEIPAGNSAILNLPISDVGSLVSIGIKNITLNLNNFKKSLLVENGFAPNLGIISPSDTLFWFYNETCVTESQTVFYNQFGDGEDSPIECSQMDYGRAWAPTSGSFEIFAGQQITGTWQLYIDSSQISNNFRLKEWAIEYCYLPNAASVSYSVDIAQSNLNQVGFRMDSGTYYLTSIYRNPNGELLYVTLSTSNPELFKK